MNTAPYVYKVRQVRRVIDGDTYDFTLDLGFFARMDVRVRLLGVDTPEVRGPEKKAGLEATRFVEQILEGAQQIRCETRRPDHFGRWLGNVFVLDDNNTWASLADLILDSGHGEPYTK